MPVSPPHHVNIRSADFFLILPMGTLGRSRPEGGAPVAEGNGSPIENEKVNTTAHSYRRGGTQGQCTVVVPALEREWGHATCVSPMVREHHGILLGVAPYLASKGQEPALWSLVHIRAACGVCLRMRKSCCLLAFVAVSFVNLVS